MELIRKYLLLAGLAGGVLLTVAWFLFLAYEAGRLFALNRPRLLSGAFVCARPQQQLGQLGNTSRDLSRLVLRHQARLLRAFQLPFAK